jgi:hypothetical protein
VILILIDDDLGQESRPGQATLERRRRLGRDRHLALAALTGVLDTLVLEDEDLGRLVVVLAGALDTDFLALAAAGGAQLLGRCQFVTTLLVAQRAGRPTPAMRLVGLATLARLLVTGWRWRRRRDFLLERSEQQRLLRIDRVGTRTIPASQQGVEPLLQRLLVAAAGTQGAEQFGDHLLEDGRVIGQRRGVDARRHCVARLRLRGGRWHVGAHT